MEGFMPISWASLVIGLALAVVTWVATASADDVVSSPPTPVFKAITGDLPKTPTANVRVFVGTLDPGATTLWHMHLSPPVVYVDSGSATWEFQGGRAPETRTAGQVMLEPANVVVRLANHGVVPARVIMFSVTKPDEPFFVPAH
jgi:quercetin dioxygenase-like cupin family protein